MEEGRKGKDAREEPTGPPDAEGLGPDRTAGLAGPVGTRDGGADRTTGQAGPSSGNRVGADQATGLAGTGDVSGGVALPVGLDLGGHDLLSGMGATLAPQVQLGSGATATTSTLQGTGSILAPQPQQALVSAATTATVQVIGSTLAPQAQQASFVFTAPSSTQRGLGPSTAPSAQQGLGTSSGPSGGQMAGPSAVSSGVAAVSANPAQSVGMPSLSSDLAEEFRLFKLFMEMRKGASLTTVATSGPAIQAVQPPPLSGPVTLIPTPPSNPPGTAPALGQYPPQQAQLLQRAVQPTPPPPVLAPQQRGNGHVAPGPSSPPATTTAPTRSPAGRCCAIGE